MRSSGRMKKSGCNEYMDTGADCIVGYSFVPDWRIGLEKGNRIKALNLRPLQRRLHQKEVVENDPFSHAFHYCIVI